MKSYLTKSTLKFLDHVALRKRDLEEADREKHLRVKISVYKGEDG